MGRFKYTNEQLADAVASAFSFAQVTRILGMGKSGTASTHIKKRVDTLGLDYSHFTGSGWSGGAQARNRKTAEQILVHDPLRTRRVDVKLLRRSLLELGRPYICESCDNPGLWKGEPLTLQVDHEDGDWLNNLPDNLRFLCPNCHTQTETYGHNSSKLSI